MTAPVLHTVSLYSLGFKPTGNLIIADEGGVVPAGKFQSIPNMIAMTMGNQNVIRTNVHGILGCLGVAREKGVDKEGGFGGLYVKGAVTQPTHGNHGSFSPSVFCPIHGLCKWDRMRKGSRTAE